MRQMKKLLLFVIALLSLMAEASGQNTTRWRVSFHPSLAELITVEVNARHNLFGN
jgi:hypothetical protein